MHGACITMSTYLQSALALMGALLATGARLAAALRPPSGQLDAAQLEAWPPYLILATYTTDHLPLTTDC